ncbi:hypothetical protein J32TS6_35300 [Virgibacillus pantothenticus]|uniref:hypothetical protein n=1 Tax=Virgibacillus TaxID=84406 RepID=UPI00067E1B4D|nr:MULTISPECIES: hypothetical protein [Virgibacillus]API92257.1 hypothetical protein BKP57_10690 [Virgibacillus sp. 6R]MBS7427144.1 hypothetical protein [Virgibacillus sp. 19R1-5]MBU8567501.1 hypothetical protein [Virgibacillus pantothenticus]MBU8601137.1 hypothetical protein [Virgibacillus pantothenticus]MBU8635487.1 hypothetical protein [Virgibacillus pantothenticus]
MNKVKQELDKISIPKELKYKRDLGIHRAKSEMPRKIRSFKLIYAVAITAFLATLSLLYFNNDNPPENPNVQTIESNYVININDPEEVVEFADNVFVGKVEKVDETIITNYPETRFLIKVLENIKGKLTETALINQIGGYEGNDLFLMEEDELLKEGNTYLFATINSNENDTKTIIPVGGSIEIGGEAEQAQLIEKYNKIYQSK